MGEKSIIRMGWIALAVTAVIATAELICTEKGVFAADTVLAEEIITETEKVPEKGQIREDTASGMPCENREQFERWYETYEQETSEEIWMGRICESAKGTAYDRQSHSCESEVQDGTSQTAMVESMVSEMEVGEALYTIDGDLIDPEIQRKLYAALEANGIAYWYEGALAQMYQESRGDVYAENPNGLDKGLFQFRTTYWGEPENIFDVDAQIRRYAREAAARIHAGLSTDEVISRHITSDYCTDINWQYVADVKQHLETMRRADE